MLRFWKGQALTPKLVAQTEQPVLNHSACEGRIAGLPWQQLRTSLSVWPLTAVAPDWLRRLQLPPLLAHSLPAASCILQAERAKEVQGWGPRTLLACTLRAWVGSPPQDFINNIGLAWVPFKIRLQGKRSLASKVLMSLSGAPRLSTSLPPHSPEPPCPPHPCLLAQMQPACPVQIPAL